MRNLAGNKEADDFILKELMSAEIKVRGCEPTGGEVPYSLVGKLGEWTFERAWNYWSASAPYGKGLPMKLASQLQERKYPISGDNTPETFGQVVRVGGHCGCPHPKEWAKGASTIDSYHVDTPVGLSELAKMIRR